LSIVFNFIHLFYKSTKYLNFIYLKQITKSSSRYLTNNFDNFAFLIQPMSTEEKSLHFIEQIIEENLASGFPQDKLRFRFPPEPNGYLYWPR
jgi:hypothetical protein